MQGWDDLTNSAHEKEYMTDSGSVHTMYILHTDFTTKKNKDSTRLVPVVFILQGNQNRRRSRNIDLTTRNILFH